jgi:nucleotide-binding universal stress UspA family protein
MPLGYRRVIIPVTGEPSDERVLLLANELSHRGQVWITLVYVVEVPQTLPLDADLPAEYDRGERLLASAERLASHMLSSDHQRIATDLLQARSAGAAIVDEAIERGVDAILMGARVRTIHGRLSAGETVEFVMKHAPCDVLVLRAGEEVSLEGLA